MKWIVLVIAVFLNLLGCQNMKRQPSLPNSGKQNVPQKIQGKDLWVYGQYAQYLLEDFDKTLITSGELYLKAESAFLLGDYDKAFDFYTKSFEKEPSHTAEVLANLTGSLAEGDGDENFLSLLDEAVEESESLKNPEIPDYPKDLKDVFQKFDEVHANISLDDTSPRTGIFRINKGQASLRKYPDHFLWKWANDFNSEPRNRFVWWWKATLEKNPALLVDALRLPHGNDYADELYQASVLALRESGYSWIWPPIQPKTFPWAEMVAFLKQEAQKGSLPGPLLKVLANDLMLLPYRWPEVDDASLFLAEKGYTMGGSRKKKTGISWDQLHKTLEHLKKFRQIFKDTRNVIIYHAINQDWLRASKDSDYVPRPYVALLRKK